MHESTRLIRMPEVEHLTGFKRSNIYRLTRLGEFPKPVKLGPNASAYVASEVEAFIKSKIAERTVEES